MPSTKFRRTCVLAAIASALCQSALLSLLILERSAFAQTDTNETPAPQQLEEAIDTPDVPANAETDADRQDDAAATEESTANSDEATETPAVTDAAVADSDEATETSAAINESAANSAETTAAETPVAEKFDVNTELRKARLAASAELIVAPSEQNALYYYGRILKAEPKNQLAMAELSAVLARALLIVEEHLSADEYVEAYQLTSNAASQQPNHPLVRSMRDALIGYTSDLAAEARQFAADGNDAAAEEVLASLEQLPGLGRRFATRSRESVATALEARTTAAQAQAEEEKLAEENTIAEWAQNIRNAIDSGRLIAPDGDSARDYLATGDAPEETKKELTRELFAALMLASEQSLQNDNLNDVEIYLTAANELGVVTDEEDRDDDGVEASLVAEGGDKNSEQKNTNSLSAQHKAIETKLIAAQGNKTVGLADFASVKTVPAEYPFIASKRNITGWVEVRFTVTKDGKTENIEVLQADPAEVFDGSAIKAVEQWTFEPRQYRGQPIDQRAVARLVFDLEE